MARRDLSVLAVVGAQYGSEGKGVVVASIAWKYGVHVRVGGPNAGHTFNHRGVVYKLQTVPCGWVNPSAKIVIGRGGIISPELLIKEIKEIRKVEPNIVDRLYIDHNAAILDDRHHNAEGGVNGELHSRIGSTGEGVGAVRLARIHRDPKQYGTIAGYLEEYGSKIDLPLRDRLFDTVELLNRWVDEKEQILLEGTQGSGLSLLHGPWPYVTSADTNAGQLAVDCGLAPTVVNRTLLVARTFPIRVAGNSGPLKNELTWGHISNRIGEEVEERTTVTRKVRRVGAWDEQVFQRAVMLNRPTSIAITFLDYLNPEDKGKSVFTDLSTESKKFISYVESMANCPVALVGTGGHGWNVASRNIRL